MRREVKVEVCFPEAKGRTLGSQPKKLIQRQTKKE